MSPIQPPLPYCYKFDPRDGELLVFYLKEKLDNETTNIPYYVNIIKEVNVYNHTPQILTETNLPLGEKQWYFFTERNRMHQNGGRPSRSTKDGGGYWKATSGEKDVMYKNKIVGTKQVLVFFEGKPSKAKKTNWIMHEYKVKRSNEVKFDNIALCRIYKREVKPPRNGDRIETVPVMDNNRENSLEGLSYNNDDLTNWVENNVPPLDSISELMQAFAPEYVNNFSHVPYVGEDFPVSDAQVFPVENVSRSSNNEDFEQRDLDFSKQLEDIISLEDGSDDIPLR